METWKEYRLGDVCTITSSKRIFAEQYVSEGIPFYRQKEIIEKHDKKNISDPLFISKDVFNNIKNKFGIPCKGDLLLSAVGVTLGIPYLVDSEEFYFKDGNLIWLKNFSQKVDSKYIYCWLDSKFGYETIYYRAIGSAQPALTIDLVKKIKIQLPPLPTQRRIASILSTYDALIQNYKRQIAALQSAASELYKEWFVRFRFPGYKNAKFDNGLPEGWKVERVKNCVNRLPFGQTYKKDELESKGKVIVIDQSEDEYLGFHNYEPSHKASAENPIALFGDHSCKYQLMIKNFSLGENIIPYTAKNVDLYYLYFAVYKIVQTEEYKRHWSLFVNKKILIPNKDLQMKFRDFIIPLFKKIENLQQQITNLTTQRDLLLPRLMSGKLSVE